MSSQLRSYICDSLSNTSKSTDWQDVLVKWYYPGHVGGVDSIQEALLCVSVEHDLNVEKLLDEITCACQTRRS